MHILETGSIVRSGSFDELSNDRTVVETYLGVDHGCDRMTDIVAIIVNGLVYGSIYGLVAIGMTLIYGTLRILDMSQGSMVMIGGYVGWWALATHGVNPLLALVLAFIVTFVVGTLTELVSVQPLIGRRGEVDFEMVTFITTFAVAILLTNVALQHFGPFQKNVPPIVSGNLDVYHGVSISYHELTMAGVSVAADGRRSGLFLARTRWGFAIRAVAQDLDAARSLGVPVSRLYPRHDGPGLGAGRRRRRVPRRALLRLAARPATCRCCRR